MSRNTEAKLRARRAGVALNCAEEPERETGPIGSLPIYRPFVSDRPMTHAG